MADRHEEPAVTVADAAVVLATIETARAVHENGVLGFTVTNTGDTNALTAFVVSRRMGANSAWESLASLAAHYAADIELPLMTCDGAPVTLAALASCHITVATAGAYQIKVEVTAADPATTTVSMAWTLT